jgi:hypothetical protein
MAAAVHRALKISGKPAPQRYGVPAQLVRATQRCNEGRCSAEGTKRLKQRVSARFRRVRDRRALARVVFLSGQRLGQASQRFTLCAAQGGLLNPKP